MERQIFESKHWEVTLSGDQLYLGRAYVLCKTRRGSLLELTDEEFSDLHFVIKKYEALLKKTFGATLFNWACLMNHAYREKPYTPQVHFHARPRYEKEVQVGSMVFKDPNFGDHYHLQDSISNRVSEEIFAEILNTLKTNLMKNENVNTVNRKFSLSEYDPSWVSKFNSIKDLLVKVFDEKALKVEHVGSTSVPGMKAKPLIDILVVVEKMELFEKEKELMNEVGYEWQYYPDPEGLTFSKFGPEGEKLEGIHLCEENSPWVRQFVVVRDYLRTHPEKAMEYSELKQKNIELHPNDYPAYRNAKAPFLEQLKQEAYQWEEEE